MARVNQRGDEVFEEMLGEWSTLTPDELQTILFGMLDHLNLVAIKTNATKHGDTQIEIKAS